MISRATGLNFQHQSLLIGSRRPGAVLKIEFEVLTIYAA